MSTLKTVLVKQPALKTYASLRDQVRRTFSAGLAKMEAEKVRTYWTAGKLILTHLDFHPEKSGYGNHVTRQLAEDLGMSPRILADILRFARTYPIFPARGKSGFNLNWTGWRKALQVNNPEQRVRFIQKIEHDGLSTREIESQVRKKSGPKTAQEKLSLLKPVIGTLGAYQIVSAEDAGYLASSKEVFFDHGFRIYRHLTKEECGNAKVGDIVEFKNSNVIPSSDPESKVSGSRIALDRLRRASLSGMTNKMLIKSDRSDKDLFFYQASVEKVIDGDTLWAAIEIGFSETARQKLRLRGVDAPELLNPGGAESSRFLKTLLPPGSPLLIHTSQSPSHDRFVADIFVPLSQSIQKTVEGRLKKGEGSRNTNLDSCLLSIQSVNYYFLNNLLLVLGFVRRAKENNEL